MSYLHRWTEIVDLSAARRWRTALMPEAFMADSRVLASTRRYSAAETIPSAGSFVVLELH